ncbi:MAG: pilus assembly protein PilP [Candidatus Sedimenticola endophacoides]
MPQQGEIEPLPEIRQVETFVYVAGERRDPFTVEVEEEAETAGGAGGGVMHDLNRRKEELEGYALDSLRMVGTLELSGTQWALVKTSDETIHRVKPGNYVGRAKSS